MKEKKLINIRALAILLVVLGHSIILYSSSWNLYETTNNVPFLDIIKKIISSYQMPLYFSLSGYLFYYTCLKNKKTIEFIVDKIKRLIIPFIFVGAFYMVPLKMILKVPGYKGTYFKVIFDNLVKLNQTGHLWFLISLFIIFIIFFAISKIIKIDKKDKLHITIDILILLVTLLFSIKSSFFKHILLKTALYRVFKYLFWFYLGFCLNKYFSFGKKDDAYKKIYVPYLCLLTGCLVVYRLYNSSFIVKALSTLCVVIIPYIIMPSKTNKITEYLDRNSMGMFLFHSPLIYISFTYYPNINPILMVFINFVCFGFLASLLAELIRKTPLKFMIGEK